MELLGVIKELLMGWIIVEEIIMNIIQRKTEKAGVTFTRLTMSSNGCD